MKHILKYVAICVLIVLIVSTFYLKTCERRNEQKADPESRPAPAGQWIVPVKPAGASGFAGMSRFDTLQDPAPSQQQQYSSAPASGQQQQQQYSSAPVYSPGPGEPSLPPYMHPQSHPQSPAAASASAPASSAAFSPAVAAISSRPATIAQQLSRIEAAPPATTDYMTTVIGDMPRVSESFSITLPNADQPDIVSDIAVTDDLKHQHKAYLKRNAGKFLIASQRGLVEDVDIVPQYGLRTYKCSQIQEDPNSRQVSSLDNKTTFCRDRNYSASEYQG